MGIRFTDSEIEIIKNNDRDKILELLPNRSPYSIRKFISKKFPEKIKKSSKRWEDKEIDIIKNNYVNMNKEELIKLLPNRTWSSIKLKSNSLGLDRSYDFRRESIMDILLKDTPETFYWIGFILADGHIEKGIRLQMSLSMKDFDHLKKFASYLNCENIRKDEIKCHISLQNRDVCKTLCDKFDIKSNKTENPMDFNNFNFDDKLLLSLIIGFIDGDGNIKKIHKRKDCNLTLHIHKTWLNNLIFIEDFLYRYFKIEKIKRLSKISNDGYAKLIISDSRILTSLKKEIKLFNLPVLDRKWNIINEKFVSRYVTSKMNKENVISLYKEGIHTNDISKNLNLEKSFVNRYIREYKKSNLSKLH